MSMLALDKTDAKLVDEPLSMDPIPGISLSSYKLVDMTHISTCIIFTNIIDDQ